VVLTAALQESASHLLTAQLPALDDVTQGLVLEIVRDT
jgi:hypothetical protein